MVLSRGVDSLYMLCGLVRQVTGVYTVDNKLP